MTGKTSKRASKSKPRIQGSVHIVIDDAETEVAHPEVVVTFTDGVLKVTDEHHLMKTKAIRNRVVNRATEVLATVSAHLFNL